MTLAEKLTKMRTAAGVDPADVCRFVGVSRVSYWRWEKGRSQPSFEHRLKLAQLFDVAVGSLQDDRGTGEAAA